MTSASKPGIQRRAMSAAVFVSWLFPAEHACAAQAATTVRKALPFDSQTWSDLLAHGPKPAAYVFTTTYCSTCPEVFELLHASIGKSRKKLPLVAVVMDAPAEQALRHARHYRGINQLYVFDGFEPEIRQSVDPQWHNITPYVVLVDRHGKTQRCIGEPEPAMLKAWLS
jgi:hypothetical protein